MTLRPLEAVRVPPQVAASDPAHSVFVSANAGSGKTSTLVRRVARLLLRKVRPEAILCVTFTKAAAAEMQRRLFRELGDWAVMDDEALTRKLAEFGERRADVRSARALFAAALETPGGLKITTIHAFCERLLRRFPLEAGVSPRFEVLDETAAREVSGRAREDVAFAALADPEGPIGRAYAFFSVELDHTRFGELLDRFEADRQSLGAYVERCQPAGAYAVDVWRRCGFAEPESAEAVERRLVGSILWRNWARAADALVASGMPSDANLGEAMKALDRSAAFDDIWRLFSTGEGELRKQLATSKADPWARGWLEDEQRRLARASEQLKAARIAEASVQALTLALAYLWQYEANKAALGALDFDDLIARTRELLDGRADAAWVLFKLDGGLDHLLIDEAQDTAPDQWDILKLISAEFFSGGGAGVELRTVFAVGDEKQSIFSFQGAVPERFAAERRAFEAMAIGARRVFRTVPLNESWRSAPEILGFVDLVFADAVAAAALRPQGGVPYPVTHAPTRPPGGTVELWPLVATEAVEVEDPWAPVDAQGRESANKILARRIAGEVRAMVGRGERVIDRATGKPRPMGYGDVLILVRRRGPLFDEIIRSLKTAGAPVGGADRLLLSDHVIFQDLMALGRFARFADDDLSLASLLRSPLFDIDEVSLFDLAHGRQGRLWRALRDRAAERPEWARAVAFLGEARREADAQPPFDFYARVLERTDGHGVSVRRRLFERLGREAEDAVDAFLAETLAAEGRGVTDLERLLDELALSEIEVRREHDDAAATGEVRVMTAHGAKGLEAPVVILPDTTTRATPQGGGLLATPDGAFLWAPRKIEDCAASAAARAARDQACRSESLRLLYVALTRARDRLIVCGVQSLPHLFEGSWYAFVKAAFEAAAGAGSARQAILPDGTEILRFGADPGTAEGEGAGSAAAGGVVPAWALRLAPAEPAVAAPAAPSRIASADEAPSPLARSGGLGRYRRGELIHRLLQLLPDVEPGQRESAARRLMALEPDLDPDQRAEMAAAALAVLGDPRFAAVFGPGSRAEVALAGQVGRLSVSGRVDRLLVGPDRVLVADFKTNRPAPAAIEAADPSYLTQMALYRGLLGRIFPGRAIEAALIWTDGPRLMAVPENVMARTLDELGGAG